MRRGAVRSLRGNAVSLVALASTVTVGGIVLAGQASTPRMVVAATGGFETDRSTIEAPARVAAAVPPRLDPAPAPVQPPAEVARTGGPEASPASTPRAAGPPPQNDPLPTRVAEGARAPVATSTPSVVVSRGRTDRRAVTLTFDAGADRGHAERILDVLAQQRVPAAFGLTGQWAELNRDLVARAAREGHAFINHTYNHPSFTGVSWNVTAKSTADRDAQLERTNRVLEEIAGTSARPYFRPPFGDYDASVLADVGRLGYATTVMWTIDSMGWRGLDAASITRRCLDAASPGAIYIFHVGEQSRDGDALPAVIEGLRARGFDIVPLAELLAPAS
ncbi:MAG: polysaccharide deacetylase family protein [Dehalococcoidia bacterium]